MHCLVWTGCNTPLISTPGLVCRWLAGSHVDLAVILCCARMEQGEDPPDAKRIRHLYEEAVRDHGKNNPGWLPWCLQ